ncbi:MAG: hypothetical protein NC131_04780 [Roseburia sp.]|nr:hypothetical protein [Roseburia sp.]
MIKVVSVKFRNNCKPYYFAPAAGETYEKGAGVIVETSKGPEYATVVQPVCEVEDGDVVAPLKPIVRKATARDEEQVKRNLDRRGEAMKTAQEKIRERGLEMKLVDCEFAFDGSKVIFSFTAESRVDFRELIKDLSSAFHMRIELRQISIRDEIKITGGLAPCGRECCCINCMAEPKKVSVKMAKNQGLSLNPGKISGLCGRLMCCLSYENEYYAEACKKVPKLGGEVDTPNGRGTVVNVNMLKMQVKVKIEQNDAVSYHDFGIDEIKFMRGNVVMGNESLGADGGEDEGEKPEKPETDGSSVQKPESFKRGEPKGERAGNDRRGDRRGNRKEGRRDNSRENRDNRENANAENGGNNGGKNRNNRDNRRSRDNRDNRGVKEGRAENGQNGNRRHRGEKHRGGHGSPVGGGGSDKS